MEPRGTPPVFQSSTTDRIAKLARLITTAELQPFAIKWTNKTLAPHQAALQKQPLPIDANENVPMTSDQDAVSLRKPL